MNEAKRRALQALQESMDRRDNGGPAGLPDGMATTAVEPGSHPQAYAESPNGNGRRAASANGHDGSDNRHGGQNGSENGRAHTENGEAGADVWATARQREFAAVS